MKLSKRYPSFIRDDKSIKKLKKINKVFPLIGLGNRSLSLDYVMDRMGEDANDFYRYRNKGYRICFSSNPWDMATMSMRGIHSCQSWSWDISYKRHLIGSIADPCCGIIYLTNGKKLKHGKQMKRRAIVRYVVKQNDHSVNKIVIDRMYPNDRGHYRIVRDGNGRYQHIYPNMKINEFFHAVFIQAISLMMKNQDLSVGKANRGGKWFIPDLFKSKSFHNKLSFRDTRIAYRPIDKKSLPKELRRMVK